MRMLEHIQDAKAYPLTRPAPPRMTQEEYAAAMKASAEASGQGPKLPYSQHHSQTSNKSDKGREKIKAYLRTVNRAGAMRIARNVGLTESTIRPYLSQMCARGGIIREEVNYKTHYRIAE